MQHAAQPITTSFPWRGATLVVGAIAAIELVALIGIGAVHLAPKRAAAAAAAKAQAARPVVHVRKVAPLPVPPPACASERARARPERQQRARRRVDAKPRDSQSSGYRIVGAENAQRHDYAQSMVLYVPGWVKEARRLAHDTGIRLVAPVDGLRGRRSRARRPS